MDSSILGLLIFLAWTQLALSYSIPGTTEDKKNARQQTNSMTASMRMPKMGQMRHMQDERLMMAPEALESMKMMNPGFQLPMQIGSERGLSNQQQMMANLKQNMGSMMRNALAQDSSQFSSPEGSITTSESPATVSTSSDEEATEMVKSMAEESLTATAATSTKEPTESSSTESNETDMKTEMPNEQVVESTESEKMELGSLAEAKGESEVEEEEEERKKVLQSDKILDLLKETRILDLINIPNGLMDCDNEKNLFCSMVTFAKDLNQMQLPKFREMIEKISEFIKDLKEQKVVEGSSVHSAGQSGDSSESDADLVFDDSDAPKILAHLETIRKTVDMMQSLIKMAENEGEPAAEA